MLLTIEKVLILKSVGIFASVSEEQLVDIATIVEEVEYEAGDIIMSEGDLGSSMYVVVDGQVKIYKGEVDLGTMGRRAVFGDLAALDPEPRAATVEATEYCSLLRLEGEALYELMAENREVTQGIVRVLCEYARTNLARAHQVKEQTL